MADFSPSCKKTIEREGGYKLSNHKNDRGGLTYAGIARNFHPTWEGWRLIDVGDLNNPSLPVLATQFYKKNFWDVFSGDSLTNQAVAGTIYDFGVNAGVKTSVKLAQMVVGVHADGVVGPITVAAINAQDEESFRKSFAIAKMTRYAAICTKDPSQKVFLLGWLNRTLEELK